MTYDEARDYIAELSHRGWRLELDRMRELLRRAGLEGAIGANLGAGPRFIHVAGTNGKGSVTAFLQGVLSAAGHRAGSFFSPFVYDIRERIQLDGECISQEDFARLTNWLKPIAEPLEGSELGGVTEFEFKTAMGLAYWAEKEADWVALEVGLGGRLDATNVVTPACCVITSIGLDHTAILGETYEAISAEKAGILKPGIPAVVGRLPEPAQQVVEARARELGCPLWALGRDFEATEGEIRLTRRTLLGLEPPLAGRHQWDNLAVALAALEAAGLNIGEDAVKEGLGRVRLPGRFEQRVLWGRQVVLDGAHNIESFEALAETLKAAYPNGKWVLVFGMLEGHNPGPVVRLLETLASEVHLTPIDFRRTLKPEELATHFSMPVHLHRSSKDALFAAAASKSSDAILVSGSFYLVGEVGGHWDTVSQSEAVKAQ